LIALAEARVSSEADTVVKSVSTEVIAVPLVNVRLSIVALVASNVATVTIPEALIFLTTAKS
jgi:hypothetical protein